VGRMIRSEHRSGRRTCHQIGAGYVITRRGRATERPCFTLRIESANLKPTLRLRSRRGVVLSAVRDTRCQAAWARGSPKPWRQRRARAGFCHAVKPNKAAVQRNGRRSVAISAAVRRAHAMRIGSSKSAATTRSRRSCGVSSKRTGLSRSLRRRDIPQPRHRRSGRRRRGC